jgi:hypothetical protein
VKGWKSSSNWGFPKGKINETEPPASCAIREVSSFPSNLLGVLSMFGLTGAGRNGI